MSFNFKKVRPISNYFWLSSMHKRVEAIFHFEERYMVVFLLTLLLFVLVQVRVQGQGPGLDQRRTLKQVDTPPLTTHHHPPPKLFHQYQHTKEVQSQYINIVKAFKVISIKILINKTLFLVFSQIQDEHYSIQTCVYYRCFLFLSINVNL